MRDEIQSIAGVVLFEKEKKNASLLRYREKEGWLIKILYKDSLWWRGRWIRESEFICLGRAVWERFGIATVARQ